MGSIKRLEDLDANCFTMDSKGLEALVAPLCVQALASTKAPDLSPQLLEANGEFRESGYIGFFHWMSEARGRDDTLLKIFHWAKFARRALSVATLLESSLPGQGIRKYDSLGAVVLLEQNTRRVSKEQDRWVLRCDTHVTAPTLRSDSAPQVQRPFGLPGQTPTALDNRSLELAQQVLKTRAERTGRNIELTALTNRGEVARALAGQGWIGQTEEDQKILSALLDGNLPTTSAIRNGRQKLDEETPIVSEWLLKSHVDPSEEMPTLHTSELDFAGSYQQMAPNLKLVRLNLLA